MSRFLFYTSFQNYTLPFIDFIIYKPRRIELSIIRKDSLDLLGSMSPFVSGPFAPPLAGQDFVFYRCIRIIV